MWTAIDNKGKTLVSHKDLYIGYQYCYTRAYDMKVWFDIVWIEPK